MLLETDITFVSLLRVVFRKEYLDVRGRKCRKIWKNCIMKSFISWTIHLIFKSRPTRQAHMQHA